MDSFRDRQTTDMSSYNYNIDRRLMERGNNFNQSKDKYGEITGEYLETPIIDKGMPMRSHIVPALNNIYGNDNPYLDFNLYREKPNLKVSNYDPVHNLNNDNLSFAKISDMNQSIISQPNNITNSSNIFTFDFLEKFTENIKSKKSTVLSPYSIYNCFSLLYIGSKNQTEYLLKNYFNFLSKQQTHNYMYKLNQELLNSKVFNSLNLVLYSNSFTINEAYKSYVDKIGYFIPYDNNNSVQDTKKINTIISNSTKGMINNLLSAQMLQNNKLVLINTIYFNSKWKKPFNLDNTKQEEFYGLTKTIVPMMSQKDTYHNYYEDSNNQILEMDYIDNVFSMGFILPKSQYSDLRVQSLNEFNYYISNLKSKKISIIKIPKFKTDSRYSISNLFKKYGLKEIFQNIDISEIIPKMNNHDNIYVTDIIHAATIEVDESGTKASASTAMFMENSIATKPISFIANHQFQYYIRYKPQNLVIFTGMYY